MNDLLNVVFGLEGVRFGDGTTEFEFVRPIAGWVWAVIVAGAITLSVWSYRRLDGPVWARTLLASARALVVILLVLLASGPRLVKPRERTELDWIAVLVDRSASLEVEDVERNGTRVSREQQLRDALANAAPAWEGMTSKRNILWLGFGGGVDALATSTPEAPIASAPDLGAGDRMRTRIAGALRETLRRTTGARLSGVVLLTDGRSADTVDPELIATLADARVNVATVPLGSPGGVGDLAIRSVRSPGEAFVGDFIPVSANIERRGDGAATMSATAELVDIDTGEVLAESLLDPEQNSIEFGVRVAPESLYGFELQVDDEGEESREITLVRAGSPAAEAGVLRGDRVLGISGAEQDLVIFRRALSETPPGASVTLDLIRDERTISVSLVAPEKRVDRKWQVRISPDGVDLASRNNTSPVGITLIDRPLRVLHLDGYPRWEYRFVKNLLVRETSIDSSSLLLAAGRAFLAEGNTPLDAPPLSPEDWSIYDVVVLGDVRSGAMGPRQIEYLRDLVALRGAGLLWIGGEGATPWSWDDTELSDLLPFTLSGSDPVRAREGDSVLLPTQLAKERSLLLVGEDVEDESSGWSRLRYAQRLSLDALKPATEVLAVASSADQDLDVGDPTPVVVTMRYGAGRIVYVATDEIWRWRYGIGETLPERFYVPLVRWLGSGSQGRGGRRAVLEVNPGELTLSQEAQVSVTLLEQELAGRPPPDAAVLIRAEGEPIERAERVPLSADSSAGDPLSIRVTTLSTGWTPRAAGRYIISATGGALAELGLETTIDVIESDDERRRPEADHESLAEFTASLGEFGMMLTPDELSRIPSLIPARPARIELRPEIITLWDRLASLLALLSLLAIEWAGRRLVSLS